MPITRAGQETLLPGLVAARWMIFWFYSTFAVGKVALWLWEFSHGTAGYLELTAAFWQLNLTNLDISGWYISSDWHLLEHAAEFAQALQPQKSIREVTFSCKVEEGDEYTGGIRPGFSAARCNCHSQILIDILEKLPLLESLHYTMERGPHERIINVDEEYDEVYDRNIHVQTREKACDDEEGSRSLARALSHHRSIRSLHLHGWAYRLLYEVSQLGFNHRQTHCRILC